MDLIHERCTGMDISKRDAIVCVRTSGERRNTFSKKVTVHGAMHHDIQSLCDYLVTEEVTLVVMEATGDYWKPFFYGLENDLNVILVNARHAKNLPGRKTDVSDAQWLAVLAAHGLVRASFIPPRPIRQLRDLTRQRTLLTAPRSRETQRLEKLIESTGTPIMLRQLGRVTVAVLDAHAAAEDARRAEQLTAMMHEKFAQVQQQLPEIPSKQNGPETRTVTSESETMRRAAEGLAAPGIGSPLPTTLRPGKHKAPVTPRERDGLGRE